MLDRFFSPSVLTSASDEFKKQQHIGPVTWSISMSCSEGAHSRLHLRLHRNRPSAAGTSANVQAEHLGHTLRIKRRY